MCVLCPRQFKENIMPNYKNPKLLSQFVSPHTGHVYQAHITGLCSYMQVGSVCQNPKFNVFFNW